MSNEKESDDAGDGGRRDPTEEPRSGPDDPGPGAPHAPDQPGADDQLGDDEELLDGSDLGSDVEVDAEVEIDEDDEDGLLGGLQVDSSEEIRVPDRLVDQVIGQDHARDVVMKAAKQRRHVMMIGTPGTGKSMLAKAMSPSRSR